MNADLTLSLPTHQLRQPIDVTRFPIEFQSQLDFLYQRLDETQRKNAQLELKCNLLDRIVKRYVDTDSLIQSITESLITEIVKYPEMKAHLLKGLHCVNQGEHQDSKEKIFSLIESSCKQVATLEDLENNWVELTDVESNIVEDLEDLEFLVENYGFQNTHGTQELTGSLALQHSMIHDQSAVTASKTSWAASTVLCNVASGTYYATKFGLGCLYNLGKYTYYTSREITGILRLAMVGAIVFHSPWLPVLKLLLQVFVK